LVNAKLLRNTRKCTCCCVTFSLFKEPEELGQKKSKFNRPSIHTNIYT
jgi:hypothetical protein